MLHASECALRFFLVYRSKPVYEIVEQKSQVHHYFENVFFLFFAKKRQRAIPKNLNLIGTFKIEHLEIAIFMRPIIASILQSYQA